MNGARFVDHHVFREHFFSLGVETLTGRPYLSTPVSSRTRMIDYEAYFLIDPERFARFRDDPGSAASFLEDCRQGRNADLLVAP